MLKASVEKKTYKIILIVKHYRGTISAKGYYPGRNPTTAPGRTDESKSPSWQNGGLQEAKRTREKFPETWVWETMISGYDIYFQLIVM